MFDVKRVQSLSLANVSNAIIKDISLSNAKGFHLRLHSARNVTVHNVSISSPWDSPNTDGIHIHSSSFVNITNSTIGVGDDCVSISTGSLDVLVSDTRCGPGHGFRYLVKMIIPFSSSFFSFYKGEQSCSLFNFGSINWFGVQYRELREGWERERSEKNYGSKLHRWRSC